MRALRNSTVEKKPAAVEKKPAARSGAEVSGSIGLDVFYFQQLIITSYQTNI